MNLKYSQRDYVQMLTLLEFNTAMHGHKVCSAENSLIIWYQEHRLHGGSNCAKSAEHYVHISKYYETLQLFSMLPQADFSLQNLVWSMWSVALILSAVRVNPFRSILGIYLEAVFSLFITIIQPQSVVFYISCIKDFYFILISKL